MFRAKFLLTSTILFLLSTHLNGWVGITHQHITRRAVAFAHSMKITAVTAQKISAIAYWNLMTDFRNDLRMSYFIKRRNYYKKIYSRSFEFFINGRKRIFNHFSSLQHFYDPYKKTGFRFQDIRTPLYKKGVAHISRKRGSWLPISPFVKPSNQYETTIIFPSGKKVALINASFISARIMMIREYKKLLQNRGNRSKQLGAIFHLFQDVTVPYHTLNALGSLQLGSAKWVSHANYIVRAMRYCRKYGINKKLALHYYSIYWKKFIAMQKNLDLFFHYIAMETASQRSDFKKNLHRCAGMSMVLVRHLKKYL